MTTFLIAVLLTIGLNTIVWTLVGAARVLTARLERGSPVARTTAPPSRDQVAVVVAAHNEQLVISKTIASAAGMLPVENVFVVSDGSTDATADIAAAAGATVLELHPNRGKASALAAVIEEFDLAARFEVVLLLDADTQLAPDYFDTGLPLFSDPSVVAVAGRATTLPDAHPSSLAGRIVLAYRERVYIAMQYFLKFGQAASRVNAVTIVPGFASMYRSRILADIDIAAAGLTIEDYNMTFEVHAKKLGRIAFHPHAAIALTQDPDTLKDYTKQVGRWNLGFWQTVRRHGPHLGTFWVVLGFFIAELLASSILMLAFFPLLATSLTGAAIDLNDGPDPTTASALVAILPPLAIALGVLLPDYLLTVAVAIITRRPAFLVWGAVFPLLRTLDAFLCLRALGRAFGPTTSGTWTSPERRSVNQVDPVRT